MELEKMYALARKRHGQVGEDVVHDLFIKFGGEMPPDAYVRTCIMNARPSPLVDLHDVQEEPDLENMEEDRLTRVSALINKLREEYPTEVDTFLACRVNGDLKAFSLKYGVTRSVLEKICNFVKHKIETEYGKFSMDSI